MDRAAAMLFLLGGMVSTILLMIAIFNFAPMFFSCLAALLYILYYFLADESSELHHAQEFENRFWTIFALLLASAAIFVRDSPFAFGGNRPWLGTFVVLLFSYGMHTWDRMMHRKEMSRQVSGLRRGSSANQSLNRLNAMGIPVEEQLERISECMANIDQLLVPSTINNFINETFIQRNERDIISIFEEAQPKALNWLISHVKLALIFYKIKDHRNFRGNNRTEMIELLAVDRISILNVLSRVLLLHALQLMKLAAHSRSEHWVRHIIMATHRDELSELKTMTDAKGDYFCMDKLVYEDIRSDTIRQDILSHFRKEADVLQAHIEMGTHFGRYRLRKTWRKVLSDVDDTLTSSGGSYPAGIDKRYNKKVVYPGVIGFYRELDIGTKGPEEFPKNTVGNLVFLSARPHVYKDMSEKHNFAKFEKLRERKGVDGRGGLHTIPSLLPGDLTSGLESMMNNDFEPLARKKFDNFKRYVSIYPEYKHVFICDNGQGDVRAGELVHDKYPQNLEGLYVHLVQDIRKTYGFDADRWRRKGLDGKSHFFTCYPDAALHAATRKRPLIRISGLRRVCQDAVADFEQIMPTQWTSHSQKRDRRAELNQSLWKCNKIFEAYSEETVPLVESPRLWQDGQQVRTPYGIGTIKGFDSVFDLYNVDIDWRPLDVQVKENAKQESSQKEKDSRGPIQHLSSKTTDRSPPILQTVVEEDETISPAPSFDVLKHSSKASLSSGMGQLTESHMEDKNESIPEDDLIFDALAFDREEALSLEPTETSATASTSDEVGVVGSKNRETNGSAVPLSVTTNEERSPKECSLPKGCFRSKIQGRLITEYTPPSLPKLPSDKGRSQFSFWGRDSAMGKADASDSSKLSPGEKVTTPYGTGTVVEHRQNSNIVVIDMNGWPARSFLRESVVKRVGTGYFEKFFRRQKSPMSMPRRHANAKVVAELKFPHAVGTKISTPFGEGVVTRPLPLSKDKNSTRVSLSPASSISSGLTPKPDVGGEVATMGISLTSWTLANGQHPILYCSPNIAGKWKDEKKVKGGKKESSLFSVLGKIVTGTSTLVSGTVDSLRRNISQDAKGPPIEIQVPLHERYYKDGAAVTTAYGDGVVRSFRESDGFYSVSLLMKSGQVFATAYIHEDSLSYRLAKGCIEGYPVLTRLGFSGVLQSVNPTTGVHNIIVPSCGVVCYFQPEEIVRPLKAAVGEGVFTPYGEGRVLKYRLFDNVYEIKLSWGNAILYAKSETFDRIDDRMEDKGGFGMGWILEFFYSREENKGKGGSQRSRSNSLVSNSMLSQSGRSIYEG